MFAGDASGPQAACFRPLAESLTIAVTSQIQKPIEANSKEWQLITKYVRDVSNKTKS